MTVIVKNAGKFEGVHYAANSTQTLASDLELRMVNDGFASFTIPKKTDGLIKKTLIESSRFTTIADDASIAGNYTANAYTITVAADTIPNGFILEQLSSGLVTANVSGISTLPSQASFVTTGPGSKIVFTPTPVANLFGVSVV